MSADQSPGFPGPLWSVVDQLQAVFARHDHVRELYVQHRVARATRPTHGTNVVVGSVYGHPGTHEQVVGGGHRRSSGRGGEGPRTGQLGGFAAFGPSFRGGRVLAVRVVHVPAGAGDTTGVDHVRDGGRVVQHVDDGGGRGVRFVCHKLSLGFGTTRVNRIRPRFLKTF